MLSFYPTSRLENALKTLHSQMVEMCSRLTGISVEEAGYLQRFAFISNIGASTRIENAVLTNSEIEWIDTILSHSGHDTAFEENRKFVIDKLSKDRERSIDEVAGCRQMLSTIYLQAEELFPLTEVVIRGLHHELLRYYPRAKAYAGRYKTSPNKVISYNHETGEQRIVLEPSDPGIATEIAMAELVQWYNRTLPEYPWPVLAAVEFVFRFLAIHPFQDGNGRLGRGLFILALVQSVDSHLNRLMPFMAVDRHIEQSRALYYTTLQKCSGGKFRNDPVLYQIEPLAWFYIKMLTASLTDIDLYRNRYSRLIRLSESAVVVLNCFKSSPEKRLKSSEITGETDLPRRTVQYALKTLHTGEFVQRLGQGAGTRYQLVF